MISTNLYDLSHMHIRALLQFEHSKLETLQFLKQCLCRLPAQAQSLHDLNRLCTKSFNVWGALMQLSLPARQSRHSRAPGVQDTCADNHNTGADDGATSDAACLESGLGGHNGELAF